MLLAFAVSGFSWAQWEILGDTYASDPSAFQSMAFDQDGVPYIALKDGSAFGNTSVVKLENDSWVNVGVPGLDIEGLFGTDEHVMAFDSQNTPYVAYRDLNQDLKPSVQRYNGTSWEYLGEPGITLGATSYVSFVIGPDDTPYIAFREAGLADKVSVMMFNGSEWEYVGEEGFSTWDSTSAYLSLQITDEGELFIAFQEEFYGDAASVMRYDGSEWVYVGSAGFSDGAASFESLGINSQGQLFVAYRDNALDGKCTVMTYSDNDWTYVGSAGFSPGAVSFVELKVDPIDRIVVTYKDWENGSRTTVLRYEDDDWQVIGTEGFSTETANHQNIALNQYGHMFVAYEIGDMEVQRFRVDGCNDPIACNYELDATDDDGSCSYLELYEITGEIAPESGSTHFYEYPETAGSTYFWEVTNGTIVSGQGTATVEVEWGAEGEGVLTVVETNAEECMSDTVTFEVSIPLDIDGRNEIEFSLNPNPTTGVTWVWHSCSERQQSLEIFSMAGERMLTQSISGHGNHIVINLPAGLYLAHINCQGVRYVQKLVIQ